VSTALQSVELMRELHDTARDPLTGYWWPHKYVGQRGPRQRCELCGGVYENGLTKAYQEGKPDAVPPMIHHAYPVSINEGGSGHDHHTWQRAKEAWEFIFCRALEQADLPRPLGHMLVEGEWTFPQRFGQGPDQENYRYPCSKFFGDAVQLGGWLENDWWLQFAFGNAEYRLEKGVRRLRLIVFPTAVDEFDQMRMAA
jgi:hypothetical protein